MATTFAEAMGGTPAPTPQPPQAPTTTPDIIGNTETLVDPRNGEVIDLGAAPSDQLGELILECRIRKDLLETWRRAATDELLRRHDRLTVVGDIEIRPDHGRGKEWDPDDLKGVVLDLIDQGVLSASDVTDLITNQPAKVNGNIANRLLDRLTGEHRELVAGCYRLTQKRRPSVDVSRVANLADALPKGNA
jgi:hypothetical protein